MSLLSSASAQWLETTIYLPEGSGPAHLCYNPTDNKVYCANWGDGTVSAISGSSNHVRATVDVGAGPQAICYNPTSNKIYCSNANHTVSVIDGASNHLLASPSAAAGAALGCNATNNKVLCGQYLGDTVTVIDGSTDHVLRTIVTGENPYGFAWNPVQNRVYVANCASSSISVQRDSGGGIEELPNAGLQTVNTPTIVRDRLELSPQLTAFSARLGIYDIDGREVLDIPQSALRNPQSVDVSRLNPGIYFVKTDLGDLRSARKIVIQR